MRAKCTEWIQFPEQVCCAVCPAVLAVCAAIKLVDGHIAWQLDRSNYALTLYRTSQFMLSLLMAFRLVRTTQLWQSAAAAAPPNVSCLQPGITAATGEHNRQLAGTFVGRLAAQHSGWHAHPSASTCVLVGAAIGAAAGTAVNAEPHI